jgi:hypothetical protein
MQSIRGTSFGMAAMRVLHGLWRFMAYLVVLSRSLHPDIGVVNILSTFRHIFDKK